jgi:hypothetical protein
MKGHLVAESSPPRAGLAKNAVHQRRLQAHIIRCVLDAAAWDGWGSAVAGSIVGGAVGAGAVVLGVWLTQQNLSRDRKAAERDTAAAELIKLVHDTRDTIKAAPDNELARYHLWPLRRQLLLSRRPLQGRPALAETQAFYKMADELREWARGHPFPPGASRYHESVTVQLADYRAGLDRRANWVINLLIDHLDDDSAPVERPPSPALPS